MKGTETTPDDNYVRKFVTECGRVEYGLHQVMFGLRFRAGRVGEMWVHCDWCCGTDPGNIALAFVAFEKALEMHDDPAELFMSLPSHSQVKPFHKDPEFMDLLHRLSAK